MYNVDKNIISYFYYFIYNQFTFSESILEFKFPSE